MLETRHSDVLKESGLRCGGVPGNSKEVMHLDIDYDKLPPFPKRIPGQLKAIPRAGGFSPVQIARYVDAFKPQDWYTHVNSKSKQNVYMSQEHFRIKKDCR